MRKIKNLTLGGLVFLSIVSSVLLVHHMADDAYIYLRVAQNIAHRGEWSFNPGVPVNAATSPLYALFLSLIVALHPPGIATPLVLASALSLSVLALSLFFGMKGYGPVTATLAAVIGSTFPALLQSEGMETALYLACIAATALASQVGGEFTVGVLAGLTALGRPEGAMMIPLSLAILWWRSRRFPWRGLILALLPLLLWCGFCLHTFHTILPHTLKIKAMQATLPAWHHSWLAEFIAQLKVLRLLAPLAAIGAFLSLRDLRRRPFAGCIILYGMGQTLAYAIMHAPVTYFWYDAPGDLAYMLSLVLGLVALLGWAGQKLTSRPETLIPAALAACLCAYLGWNLTWQWKNAYPYRMSPEYIAAAQWIRQHAQPTDWVAADEIGYLAVYSGHPVRDMLGLADADSVTPLQQHQWDFWFTTKTLPRFIVIHTPAMPGEPGSVEMPWPQTTLNAYQSHYHVVFTAPPVQIAMRNE